MKYTVTNEKSDFAEKMDEFFTDMVHSLSGEFMSYIKNKIFESNIFGIKENFQLDLVVDTNILFQEVRSLAIHNSSFFLRISDNPFIKVYAPNEIRIELYEKIKLKFPKEKATRDLDINDCLRKADLLLSKISISNDIATNSYKKANEILENRDVKDVPFLALSFSLNTHGIISKDKDISDQSEVRTWELKAAGKVVSDVSKGTFSFFILANTTPYIWEMVYDLVTSIWAAFIEFCKTTIILISSVTSGAIRSVANMPPALAIALAVVALLLVVIDSFREGAAELMAFVWDALKKVIEALIKILKSIWHAIKDMVEALKPFLEVSAELFMYLIMQSNQSVQLLQELEESRPNVEE